MPVSERFLGANVIDAGRLSPYWGEHAARYRFALPFIEGKTVLDIACGTGYGIGIMRPKAGFVVGVDRDPVGVASASAEAERGAGVLLGDGLDLPFADGSFDVVVSFETLEHLGQRREFLAELQRVLKIGGLLLLSTPNAHYTQPVNGKPSNPFHVYEYTPEELELELKEFFAVENCVGQFLDPEIEVPPFHDAQQRLPKDIVTQMRLLGWKVINRLPVGARDSLSNLIWGKPFYPSEEDYCFSEGAKLTAPVTFAICRRR